jgi:hypothetical protein
MAGQVAYHLLAQAGAARAPWPITTLVSCLPAGPWSWPWGPRWPTCSAPMPAPQRTDQTTGPEDQQHRGPQPGPPRTSWMRSRARPRLQPLRPGPVLP